MKKSTRKEKNNLKNITDEYITLDFTQYRRFFKVSDKALDQRTSKKVIETILNKYKNKMNKLGYKVISRIIHEETIKAGYKGNLGNDYIWIRDAVIPFLLTERLNEKNNEHYGNYKVVYKKIKIK